MKDWPTYFQNINSMATALKLTETFSLHLQKSCTQICLIIAYSKV